MNASSIEVFQPDLLMAGKFKANKTFGSDSFMSDFAKIGKSPHLNRTKSLHKSQLNKTSLFFPENSQFNSITGANKCSKNLSKMFSESRFSCKDSSFLMKKTVFGESMIEKLLKWEQGFEIDEEFHEKLGNCFSDLEHKIQTLENQFCNALSLNKRLETQIFEMSEIAKGWSFLKISYKNPKKTNYRTVFYSHNLEAICWKDQKSKLPKTKQLIYLKDIRNIVTKTTKNLIGHDINCFLSIETSQRSLDLIAPNLRIKESFLRLMNNILKSFKQNFGKDEEMLRALSENREFGFLNDQHNAQIELMRKEIVQTKIVFEDVTGRLRKNFFETARLWLKEEKNKGLALKKHTAKCEEKLKTTKKNLELMHNQKNKISKELSETLLKNKHLLKQMKQILDQSNTFSLELAKIVEDLKEYLKKTNQTAQDLEEKHLENISFNLIDSRYMEFDKMNNFSSLNELKKAIECLFKTKDNGVDIRKFMEENEMLKKNNCKLQSCLEQMGVECQVKDEFIEKLEQNFVELKYKQNQLISLVDNEYLEVVRKQRCLKEEIMAIFNEKSFTDLVRKNEGLEKMCEDKCEELKGMEGEYMNHKKLFEEKVKELLKRVADQDVQIYNLLKNDGHHKNSTQPNQYDQELKCKIDEKCRKIEALEEELKEKKVDMNILEKKFEQSGSLYDSIQKEFKISQIEIQDLKLQIKESELHEITFKSEIESLSQQNKLLERQMFESKQKYEDFQLKTKEDIERQFKTKIDFTQNNLNSLKKLYEENKTTLIELKKNLLILYFSFMVILSSYYENKENCHPNEMMMMRSENSFNYVEKFQNSLQIFFCILNDFFPRTNFKELENSMKKVFNLVVRTPTEFNRKPLDDLYQKLDKIYNKNSDNDASLSSMRSFCLEGLASPKISELNSSCLKFNNL